MTLLWDWIKLNLFFALPLILLGGTIYSAVLWNGWYLWLFPIAIYGLWVTLWYYDGNPPRWYCRLKWGRDTIPYYSKSIGGKKTRLITGLCWPLINLSVFIVPAVVKLVNFYVYLRAFCSQRSK